MFYVYEWFNVETNDVFYVGKGCGRRYKPTNKRNERFKEYCRNNECDYRIVKTFDNEKDAFEYEDYRISELKDIGQAECNIYSGGFGGLSSIWTKDMRDKQSKNNPMKNEKQRLRMKNNNPMKNKETAQKVGDVHTKAVVIDQTEYPSIISASKALGVSQGTIIKWCRKGVDYNLKPCRYKDCEQIEYKGIRYNKGSCKPLTYKGKWYETAVDLAKELNLKPGTINGWAKKGFDPDGNSCRYEDDKEEHTFKRFVSGASLRKPIVVNGIQYPSKADAEKALGLSKGYLAPYIAGTRKNSKYICQYANQQPNQGNADESTLEGSTTNG